MSSSIEKAEQEIEKLTAERFKLLLQLQEEIVIGEKFDQQLVEKLNEQQKNLSLKGSEVFFVSGYPPETTDDDLHRYFYKFGEVHVIKMKKSPVYSAVVVFVSLKDKEHFKRRIHKVNGKVINIASCSDDGEKTILLSGSMAKYLTEANVIGFFSDFGKVNSVDVIEDNYLVEFEDKLAFNMALSMLLFKKKQ